MATPRSTSDTIQNTSQSLNRLIEITNDVVINLNTTVGEIYSTVNDLRINIDSVLANANKSIDEATIVFGNLNTTFDSIQKSSQKFDSTIVLVNDIIVSVQRLNILDKAANTIDQLNTSIVIVNWTLILSTSFISLIMVLKFILFIFKLKEKNKYEKG